MKNNRIFDDIMKVIKDNHAFLIISHVNPDGDAIGSELAMLQFLKKLDKKAIIVNQDELPKIYDFLPNNREYIKETNINRDLIDKINIAIILDSSNLNRIGDAHNILQKKTFIINIDHHCSNDDYGHINYVDTSASSTGEIIFDFIKYFDPNILDKSIATCLFAAIMTDTGSFRYENTTKKTFEIVSMLASTGIKTHVIAQNIYNRRTFGDLKLLGLVLATLEEDENGKISWVTINRKMLERTHTTDENTEGIIEMVNSLKESEVSLLFRETYDQHVKISLRSKGHFDVNQFALAFNGGGHPNAAGCLCKGNIDFVKNEILSTLKTKIREKYSL